MRTETAHMIKHREHSRDDFFTPRALAKLCIDMIPIDRDKDFLLDPARGRGAFYEQFETKQKPDYCEIAEGLDFFAHEAKCDWIITNPPYSVLDDWFRKTLHLQPRKGFAYLLGWNNLTARRLECCEQAGYGLTRIKMFKVFRWFGMSGFFVFEKGKESIIEYERTVWRD